MENTNNKITETKFTQNDVLKGLMAMNEELRQYIGNITLEQLDFLANNPEYLEHTYKTFDVYIAGYQKMKEAVKVFVETIRKQKEKGCQAVIDDMIEKYEGFSREEKLEFNTKLLEATKVENSIDTFRHVWNKFMNTLSGISA